MIKPYLGIIWDLHYLQIVYIVLRMTSGSTKAELDREFAAADPTRSSKKKVEDFPAAR